MLCLLHSHDETIFFYVCMRVLAYITLMNTKHKNMFTYFPFYFFVYAATYIAYIWWKLAHTHTHNNKQCCTVRRATPRKMCRHCTMNTRTQTNATDNATQGMFLVYFAPPPPPRNTTQSLFIITMSTYLYMHQHIHTHIVFVNAKPTMRNVQTLIRRESETYICAPHYGGIVE